MTTEELTINPIKRLRELESLSLNEVIDRADISRGLLIRAEMGTFEEIPPKLLDFFVEYHGYSQLQIAEDYKRFVTATRIQNFGKLTSTLPPSYSPVDLDLKFLPVESFNYLGPAMRHPFVQWRLYSGLTKQLDICRFFCVHQGHLSNYELKSNYLKTPAQLLTALLVSGYASSVLSELEIRYQAYRRFLTDQKIGRVA
jgi:hypothetical protein